MPKAKRSVEEIKQDLKQEIIRLGIQDNPSRTVYQKEYRRGVAPSPNGALKATGMKWQELMSELGFEYDGKKNHKKVITSKEFRIKMGEHRGLRLTDPQTLRFVVDESLKIMREKNITNVKNFEKTIPLYLDTSYRNLLHHGYSFEKLKELYFLKYGQTIENDRWSNKTSEELLNDVIEYMRSNELISLSKYDNSIDKEKMPPSYVLMRRLNKTYKSLSRIIRNSLQ